MHGAVVGGNFSLIREHSSTVKNRRNCVKGLKYIWKNRDPNLKQSVNSGTKRTHFQWQSVFSGMEQPRQFRDETYGDVKILGYNRWGRIIWGRNVRGCIICTSSPLETCTGVALGSYWVIVISYVRALYMLCSPAFPWFG